MLKKLSIFRFLGQDVNIHGRGLAEEAVHGRDRDTIFPPIPHGRQANDDLSNVLGVAKSVTASATLFPLRRTTFAPRLSAKRKLAASAFGLDSRGPNSRST